jgi:hypothetical protein
MQPLHLFNNIPVFLHPTDHPKKVDWRDPAKLLEDYRYVEGSDQSKMIRIRRNSEILCTDLDKTNHADQESGKRDGSM